MRDKSKQIEAKPTDYQSVQQRWLYLGRFQNGQNISGWEKRIPAIVLKISKSMGLNKAVNAMLKSILIFMKQIFDY